MKIELRDPNSLRRHPLHKAHVPTPARTAPEWKAFTATPEWVSFADTVHADGRIITPIIITKDGLVMDGWNRREAAHDFQFAEVPCEVRDAGEAPLFLVESLTARKQMTRGAAVYLALGLLPAYASACEDRRIRNVAAKRATNEAKFEGKDVIAGDHRTDTLRYLAGRWGCSPDTVFHAREVRKHLHDLPTFTLWIKKLEEGKRAKTPIAEHATLQAALREEFESALFTGAAAIKTVLPAIAGRFAGVRGEPQAEQLGLFDRHFNALLSPWKKLNEDGREFLAKKLPHTFAAYDRDLLELIISAGEKALEKFEAAAE